MPWRGLCVNCHTQNSASPKSEKECHHWLPCEIPPKMHISYVHFGKGMLKQWHLNLKQFEFALNQNKSNRKRKGEEKNPSGLLSGRTSPTSSQAHLTRR